MFTTTLLGHYIPLTWLTLGFNYVLGGLDPRGYHLGNFLLHAANVALFYLVARRLLTAGFREQEGAVEPGIALGAATAALVFGVHPLRVESVAWITERRDVLCATFYLLAVWAYLRGAAAGGPVHGWWLAASLAANVAALLSKAMAMTLPVTLVLLDIYPLRRRALGWRRLAIEKLPYAILAAAGALVAVLAVSRGSPFTAYDTYGPGARLAMVGYSLWFYPHKLLSPTGLSPLHELPARVDPLSLAFLGPGLTVVLITATLIALRRAWPAGLAAWAHSAIVLAPVSGVVHAGHQLAHDRYSYLSGLGFAILAGAGVSWVWRARRERRVAGWVPSLVLTVVVLGALGWGVVSWSQSAIWRSSEALWTAALEVDPRCAICRNNLGAALMEGRAPTDPALRVAEGHLREAVVLRPGYPDSYRSLAALLSNQGRYGEAEAVLHEMIRARPDLEDGPTRLAAIYAVQGRYPDAVALLRAALRSRPQSVSTRAELGRALNNQGIERAAAGQTAEAAPLFMEAARLLPQDPIPLENLGRLRVEQGKPEQAVADLQGAVARAPGSAQARFWLARAYLATGEETKAAAEIAALARLDPARAARVRNPKP